MSARVLTMNATSGTNDKTADQDGSAVRSSESLKRTSGRDRAEWFALMDEWGAAGRPYRQITDWLTGEQGLSRWWAQKLIVEYEQARGVRAPGIRRDGTFTVGVSRSIGVPASRAYDAFVVPEQRARWLPGVEMRERTSQLGRSARFDWEDRSTRISVTFSETSPGRCDVAVEHERLPSAQAADRTKAFWRDRLGSLKALLEGGRLSARSTHRGAKNVQPEGNHRQVDSSGRDQDSAASGGRIEEETLWTGISGVARSRWECPPS
jgi:hypothetical protein